jgi:hypothetical protein
MPEEWPVLRHVSVNPAGVARVELCTGVLTEDERLAVGEYPFGQPAHSLSLDTPNGDKIVIELGRSGVVTGILLSPAEHLLPPDVQREGPMASWQRTEGQE